MTRRNKSQACLLFFFVLTQMAHAQSAMSPHQKLWRQLGCSDWKSSLWTWVYEQRLQNPSGWNQATRALAESPQLAVPSLKKTLLETVEFLGQEVPARLHATSFGAIQEALTELEMGDRSTPEKEKLQQEISQRFQRIERWIRILHIPCQWPRPQETISESEASVLAPRGGRQVATVLYQSCDVLSAPPLQRAEPLIQGIAIVGHHPDGVGQRRIVEDAVAVARTHYYIRQISPQNSSSCQDTHEHPPIYDYGGKPDAPTSDELDLLSNAGTGTEALGIDCSGLVFSSYASQGLKMKAEGPLLARHVYGVNAGMISDPVHNGLNCLERVPPSSSRSLQSGDLIAQRGHVVLVQATGVDPWGLARAHTPNDCTSKTLGAEGFHFKILQSSPNQGGIGVNLMEAADYLMGSERMRKSLVRHAVVACQAQFGKISELPEDTESFVVRHSDAPKCRTTALKLRGSECIASCQNL